jgi:cobalt/nickel transport system permease protein
VLARLHPGANLFCAFVYIAAVISYPPRDLAGLLPMGFYPALLVGLSGTRLRPVLLRCAAALPFALAVGAGNLFYQRESLFSLGPFTVTLGCVSFLSLILKTMLSVSSLLLAASALRFERVCALLARAGAPGPFILQLAMTGRYLSVLRGEARSMRTAYLLRSRGRARGVHIRDAGAFLGSLFLRSFDRAERVSHSMRLRGFAGAFGGGAAAPAWALPDTLFCLAVTTLIVLARTLRPAALLGALFGGAP